MTQEGKPRDEARGDDLGMMLMALIAAGAVSATLVDATSHPSKTPTPTPIEKPGNHHGATPNHKPGTGTLHTKSGDFHVTRR